MVLPIGREYSAAFNLGHVEVPADGYTFIVQTTAQPDVNVFAAINQECQLARLGTEEPVPKQLNTQPERSGSLQINCFAVGVAEIGVDHRPSYRWLYP